jgi:hypothetical protein
MNLIDRLLYFDTMMGPRSSGFFLPKEKKRVIPGLTFQEGLIKYRVVTGRLVQGENACFTRRKSEVQIL